MFCGKLFTSISFWYILIFTVNCGEDLAKPLLKYLNVICEDEIIGLDGRAQCLASALCVFNVLFSSNENIANMILKGNVFLCFVFFFIFRNKTHYGKESTVHPICPSIIVNNIKPITKNFIIEIGL